MNDYYRIVRRGKVIATVMASSQREATIIAQARFGHGVWVYPAWAFTA